MVKYKDLKETDKKIIKFIYITKLLTSLSNRNEQDIPLQSSIKAYDRGSTRWSVERLDGDTLRLILHTKNSNMSKYVLIKIQGKEVFVEYKANKRGLSFEDSFVYKIANIKADKYGDYVDTEPIKELHRLALESLGNLLFDDMVGQALKLAKDMKIPSAEVNQKFDLMASRYTNLG